MRVIRTEREAGRTEAKDRGKEDRSRKDRSRGGQGRKGQDKTETNNSPQGQILL